MMTLLPGAPPQSSNEDPLYNIGVVTRMTGISMATLRAWERRYDFPEAGRTAGGHRLYSERDIMRLRWVKNRIEDGMQTSQAIQALLHQEESGQFGMGEERSVPISLPSHPSGGNQSVLVSYTQDLTNAMMNKNLPKADQILGEALAASSPDELILQVIGPTMAAVGDAWENEQISIATEHLATNFLRQRILMWMVSGPPPFARPPIILACAPNEWHEGSLLMMGALLRRRRWPVIYLGQAVPLTDLASFVRDTNPSLVILVAMMEETAAELAQWPLFLPEAARTGKPIITYAGRVLTKHPEWQMRIPGTFLGDNIEQGLANIDRLLS